MRTVFLVLSTMCVTTGHAEPSPPAPGQLGQPSKLSVVSRIPAWGPDLAVREDILVAHRRGMLQVWQITGEHSKKLGEHRPNGAVRQTVRFIDKSVVTVGARRMDLETGKSPDAEPPISHRATMRIPDGRVVAVVEHRPTRGRRPHRRPSQPAYAQLMLGADVVPVKVPPSVLVPGLYRQAIVVLDTRIRLIPLDGKPVQTVLTSETNITSVFPTPTGWIAANRSGQVWTGAEWVAAHTGSAYVAAYPDASPGGFVTGGADGVVKLWHTTSPPTVVAVGTVPADGGIQPRVEGIVVVGHGPHRGRIFTAIEGRDPAVLIWKLED